MNYTPQLLPLIVPVAFWAGYHYYKDRHLPEPIPHLLLAFALGLGSFYLGLLGYRALGIVGLRYDAYQLAESNLLALFAFAILVIGLVEELAKMIPFLLVIIHLKSFNEPIDGIIYASFIALGFAAVENFQYLQFATGAEAWGRGIAGPVIHICFASIWGYYIGRAFLCGRNLMPAVLGSLAVTAILHGVYDFLVIAWPTSALPQATVLIVAIWIWRLKLIDDLHRLPPGACPFDEEKR